MDIIKITLDIFVSLFRFYHAQVCEKQHRPIKIVEWVFVRVVSGSDWSNEPENPNQINGFG